MRSIELLMDAKMAAMIAGGREKSRNWGQCASEPDAGALARRCLGRLGDDDGGRMEVADLHEPYRMACRACRSLSKGPSPGAGRSSSGPLRRIHEGVHKRRC